MTDNEVARNEVDEVLRDLVKKLARSRAKADHLAAQRSQPKNDPTPSNSA